jgi:hypothetical protein
MRFRPPFRRRPARSHRVSEAETVVEGGLQTLPQGVTDANQIGTVVDEQPAGSRRAPVGSTVTIYVGRRA